jgi:hypothetical protein
MLDGEPQRYSRCGGGMPVEKGDQLGAVGLAGLPQQPADGCVDEVLLVVHQDLRDGEGIVDVALS